MKSNTGHIYNEKFKSTLKLNLSNPLVSPKTKENIIQLHNSLAVTDMNSRKEFILSEPQRLAINNLHQSPSIYLVRHPEPGLENYAENATRSLNKQGVMQVKKFADNLINELSMYDYPVIINIRYSPKGRTTKFAELLNYYLSKRGHKCITSKESILYSKCMKSLLNNNEEGIKEFLENVTKNGLSEEKQVTLLRYFRKYVQNYNESREEAVNLNDFIESLQKSSPREVFLLLSHENTIASYLYHVHKCNIDKCWLNYTELVKFANTEFHILRYEN